MTVLGNNECIINNADYYGCLKDLFVVFPASQQEWKSAARYLDDERRNRQKKDKTKGKNSIGIPQQLVWNNGC